MQGQPAAAPMAVDMASPQPAAASSLVGLGEKGDIIAELEALKLPEGSSHQRWSNYLNVLFGGRWAYVCCRYCITAAARVLVCPCMHMPGLQ